MQCTFLFSFLVQKIIIGNAAFYMCNGGWIVCAQTDHNIISIGGSACRAVLPSSSEPPRESRFRLLL